MSGGALDRIRQGQASARVRERRRRRAPASPSYKLCAVFLPTPLPSLPLHTSHPPIHPIHPVWSRKRGPERECTRSSNQPSAAQHLHSSCLPDFFLGIARKKKKKNTVNDNLFAGLPQPQPQPQDQKQKQTKKTTNVRTKTNTNQRRLTSPRESWAVSRQDVP